MPEQVVERFRPTSGRVGGVLGLVVAAGVVGFAVVRRDLPAPLVATAVVVAVLAWAAMLRPGVWVTEEHLVLRGMLDTRRLPLAAIEEVSVRQVLRVVVDRRKHVSAAIGRRQSQVRGGSLVFGPARPVPVSATAVPSYPDFVEQQISHHAAEARRRHGVEPYSDEQAALAAGVRRDIAWPEVAALAASLAALVATLLL